MKLFWRLRTICQGFWFPMQSTYFGSALNLWKVLICNAIDSQLSSYIKVSDFLKILTLIRTFEFS